MYIVNLLLINFYYNEKIEEDFFVQFIKGKAEQA